MALFVVLLALAAAPASRAADCGDADALTSVIGIDRSTAAVGCLTNQYRQSLGLPALAVDPRLTQAAQAHADDMAARGYYEHTTPDGVDFSTRITDAGVDWDAAGENIAYQTTTPRQVLQAWIDSPEHQANLASPAYTLAGYGINDSASGTLWVQDFAHPAASPAVAPTAAHAAGKAERPRRDDGQLASAARTLAARATGSRDGRTLRLRVTVPGAPGSQARVTVRVKQRGRTVQTLSSVHSTGRSHRLRVLLPRASAGRAVVVVGMTTTSATFS